MRVETYKGDAESCEVSVAASWTHTFRSQAERVVAMEMGNGGNAQSCRGKPGQRPYAGLNKEGLLGKKDGTG